MLRQRAGTALCAHPVFAYPARFEAAVLKALESRRPSCTNLLLGSKAMANTPRNVKQDDPAEGSVENVNVGFVKAVHGVRYQVKDVARSVAFYTEHLGFTAQHQQLPAFASIALGGAQILLSGPGASGSRPMPDGRPQESGGWNRVVLKVANLPALIDDFKKTGLRFRNEMETGPGGRQIQIEDPDGNPIELFEPAR
jgi:glyoxylase I family protein